MDCVNRADGFNDVHAWMIRRYTRQIPLQVGGLPTGMTLSEYPIVDGKATTIQYESFTGVNRYDPCLCQNLVWNADVEAFEAIVGRRDYSNGEMTVYVSLSRNEPLPYYIIPANVVEMRKVMQEMSAMATAEKNLGAFDFMRWTELVAKKQKLAAEMDERLANQILFGVPTNPKPRNTVKMEVIRKGKLHDKGR